MTSLAAEPPQTIAPPAQEQVAAPTLYSSMTGASQQRTLPPMRTRKNSDDYIFIDADVY